MTFLLIMHKKLYKTSLSIDKYRPGLFEQRAYMNTDFCMRTLLQQFMSVSACVIIWQMFSTKMMCISFIANHTLVVASAFIFI